MKHVRKFVIAALLVSFAGAALADTVPGGIPDGPLGGGCFAKNGVVYCPKLPPPTK